jgi:hypothetical protein
MPLFRRGKPRRPGRSSRPPRTSRSATASKPNARRLRQAWQHDAWTYRDAIGEIRYPLEFMANAITRMRIFPALAGNPDEPPVKLDEAPASPTRWSPPPTTTCDAR